MVTAGAFGVVGALATRTVALRRRRGSAGRVQRQQGMQWWAATLVALALLELATYFAGASSDRRAVPTLSSLYDNAVHWRAAKTVFFAIWLALGWGLVRR